MKNNFAKKSLLLIAAGLAVGTTGAFGQTYAATATSALSVTVAPEAGINIAAPTSLTEATGAGIFGSPYTGTTNFTYKVRTTKTGGAGTVTVKISTDFVGTGGPSVATPPTAGDALTYSCTAAASGTPCSGSANTASTSAATGVITFGADAHSAGGGSASDAGSVTWSLTNDPVYKTGSYTATATFTISAT